MNSQNIIAELEVPQLDPLQIETAANELLRAYAEKSDEEIIAPVHVERIAEFHLQLVLEFKDMKGLFPQADVHGAIWFEEGLIAIDERLDPEVYPLMLGRYRFTLAHEIGHWYLHRHLFVRPESFEDPGLQTSGNRIPDVVCRSTNRRRPIERQADEFAANLLMPSSLVHHAWADFRDGRQEAIPIAAIREYFQNQAVLFRGRNPESAEEWDLAIKEDFSGPLADRFAVSREAMRIRLEELKLIVESD